MHPHISVILSIYNTPLEWIELSIESILNQTFSHFECILINDDPTNQASTQLLRSLAQKDQRIVLIENKTNLGLPKSLNKAIDVSKGTYIARMDADDIALPDRLQVQFNFLNQHLDVTLCGSQAVKINETGEVVGYTKNPLSHDLMQKVAKHINPLTHPTWMIRRSDLIGVGAYHNYPNTEDYDLLIRLLLQGKKIVNLRKVLLKYRIHENNQSFGRSLEQKCCMQYIRQYTWLQRSFNQEYLKTFLTIKMKRKSQKSYLFMLRSRKSNKLQQVYYLLRACFSSSIERNYLWHSLIAKFYTYFYK